MTIQIRIHRDHLQFLKYPFSASSVHTNPRLTPDRILQVRLNRFPTEIELRSGEILFVPKQDENDLKVFCQTNQIPLVKGTDIWADLAEPFLDTVLSEDVIQNLDQRLLQAGLTKIEIDEIRKKVEDSLLHMNSFAWEWIHLGHYDLLTAAKASLQNSDYYDWSMRIATRNSSELKPASPSHWTAEEVRLAFASDSTLKLTEPQIEQTWTFLFDSYSEKSRTYHNLRHVAEVRSRVTSMCHALGSNDEDLWALQLAAWFHDVVYDPKLRDNEKKSAEALQSLLPKVPSVEKACHLIEFTSDHLRAHSKSEKILFDADLAILGAAPRVFQEYSQEVRKEFSHISDSDFKKGRLQFLKKIEGFMKKSGGSLFFFSQPILNENAALNLKSEIQDLES